MWVQIYISHATYSFCTAPWFIAPLSFGQRQNEAKNEKLLFKFNMSVQWTPVESESWEVSGGLIKYRSWHKFYANLSPAFWFVAVSMVRENCSSIKDDKRSTKRKLFFFEWMSLISYVTFHQPHISFPTSTAVDNNFPHPSLFRVIKAYFYFASKWNLLENKNESTRGVSGGDVSKEHDWLEASCSICQQLFEEGQINCVFESCENITSLKVVWVTQFGNAPARIKWGEEEEKSNQIIFRAEKITILCATTYYYSNAAKGGKITFSRIIWTSERQATCDREKQKKKCRITRRASSSRNETEVMANNT